MNYIVNSLAAYEVHVARYYFRRGAYVAAANRAQQAVHEFQQSPATEEALYIMAQSYDRLGLTQLRDDADRVLQANFPNTPIYAERPAATSRRRGGSSGERRAQRAEPAPAAPARSASRSPRSRRSRRAIGGNAANRRRP